MENETFLVCVEITDGSLERDVFIGLAAVNSSNAQGTAAISYLRSSPCSYIWRCFRMEMDNFP